MSNDMKRAEITVKGRVQGVGFRYFVTTSADRLGVTGWVKNLPNGNVQAIVEGEQDKIKELYNKMKEGPSAARVSDSDIDWRDYKNEFNSFGVQY